jgi:hypothetical protein
LFLRHAQCVLNTDNTNLLTRWAYEADLWHANALIDSWIADLLLLKRDGLATK